MEPSSSPSPSTEEMQKWTSWYIEEVNLALKLVDTDLDGRLTAATTAEELAVLHEVFGLACHRARSIAEEVKLNALKANADWNALWKRARFAAELANGVYATMSGLVRERAEFHP